MIQAIYRNFYAIVTYRDALKQYLPAIYEYQSPLTHTQIAGIDHSKKSHAEIKNNESRGQFPTNSTNFQQYEQRETVQVQVLQQVSDANGGPQVHQLPNSHTTQLRLTHLSSPQPQNTERVGNTHWSQPQTQHTFPQQARWGNQANFHDPFINIHLANHEGFGSPLKIPTNHF